jgi:hypothetical protein
MKSPSILKGQEFTRASSAEDHTRALSLTSVTHPPQRLFIDFEALSKYLPALGSRTADAKSASNRFMGSMSVMAISQQLDLWELLPRFFESGNQ